MMSVEASETTDGEKAAPQSPRRAGLVQRMGGTWVVASLALVALGAGLAVADWSRSGEGGYGSKWWRHHEERGMRGMRGMRGICERDPLKFEGVARAFLKADLDLTPAQNAELDKLAQQLVPSLKVVRDEMCNNFAGGRNVPIPDQLEQFSQVLRKAADAAQAAMAPARSFYATLDDRQKLRIEELAARRRLRIGPPPGGPPPEGPLGR